MASLSRRGKSWRVTWWTNGRGSKREVETLGTKPEALALIARIEREQAARKPATRHRAIPWGELVERYLLSRGQTTAAHRDQVRRALMALAKDRGWKSSGSVTLANTEGLLPYHARVLRALLTYAQGLGQTVEARVLTDRRPRSPRRKPSMLLSTEQVAEVVQRASKWHLSNGLIVHLIATYGHRCESLVGLRWSALTLVDSGATITLPIKSGDLHRHPLLPETVDLLRALRLAAGNPTDDALMLPGHLGRPWTGTAFSTWLLHSVTGNKIGVLALRRYAITRMLDGVGDPKTVASITGHRTPSLLLNVYARTNEARQAEVIQSLSGAVAQRSEQGAHNSSVPGSNPGGPTTSEAVVTPGDTQEAPKLREIPGILPSVN